MLYTLSIYFLVFYIYSIIGYFCELISVYRLKKEIVWNRGYLLGPYLPVFGFGALIITIFLKDYIEHPITLFILGMFYCGTLEYFTSYLLEKIFHLRWWDYSYRKFNINGRICLETSVMFGLAAIILVNFSNKFLFQFLYSIPKHVIITLGIVIFMIMMIDFLISTREIFRLKSDLSLIAMKDATEEIKKKMKESLQKNYYYYEHFFRAFPNAKHRDERIEEIKKLMNKIKSKRENNEK